MTPLFFPIILLPHYSYPPITRWANSVTHQTIKQIAIAPAAEDGGPQLATDFPLSARTTYGNV